MFAYFDKYDGT